MRETEFIGQNKKKWEELEQLNKQKAKDPGKLTDLFIEVTNDLSFSKTHYANRSIKVYLNNLALSVHSNIYRGRVGAKNRFSQFWTHDLPLVVHEARRDLLLSFIVFAASMFIGVYSSMHDDSFASHILGDSYVEMTEEFIESGDPMKVYKTSKNADMFAAITINNLKVSFLVFVLGAFFGVGTIMVLIYNGVMVGAFQYFFIERDLFQESFLTIWMHGMPEILGIIVAGAAGLTLGRGLLFPGTYGRRQSFLIAARRGIMIMIGVCPIIIYAGFIEGFATRYTDIHDGVRAVCIFLSAFFMVYYFVIYPWRKFRGAESQAAPREKVPEDADYRFDHTLDKTNGRVYFDIFALFRVTFSGFIPRFLGLALVYTLAVLVVDRASFETLMPALTGEVWAYSRVPFIGPLISSIVKVDALFDYQSFSYLYVINSLFFALVVLQALWSFKKRFDKDHGLVSSSWFQFAKKQSIWIVCISIVTNAIFFIPAPLSVFVMLGVMPFLLMSVCNALLTQLRGVPFRQNFNLIATGYAKFLGLFLLIFITSIPMLILFNSDFLPLLLEVTLWNFKLDQATYDLTLAFFRVFNTAFALALVCPLYIYGTTFAYLASHEVRTAEALKEEVAQIGTHKQAYGLAKEDS